MSNLRHAIKSLRRTPWFTVAAVLTFATGIGVNLAAFSVLDRVLLRPLPYREPHRLVLLRSCAASGECFGSFPSIVAFEARTRLSTLSSFGVAARPGTYATSQEPWSGVPPLRLTGVSANLLDVLGVQPSLGRSFTEEDERLKRRVALISHETWFSRFHGRHDVLGRQVWGWTVPVTIVGVLPEGFIPPTWSAPDPRWDGLVCEFEGWGAIGPEGGISAPVARLAPGATRDTAQAEVDALVQALEKSIGRPGERIYVESLQRSLFARFRPFFWLILTASAVLLALSCVNVATLLLARGQARERQMAIQTALGASARRVMLATLLESVAVCVTGTILAVAVLALTLNALRAVLPPLIGRYAAEMTDMRVLVAAVVCLVISATVAGLMPALKACRVDILLLLQGTSVRCGPRTRLMGSWMLLGVQGALAIALLLCASLVLRSFLLLKSDDLGFDPEGLYSLSYALQKRMVVDGRSTDGGRPSVATHLEVLDALRRMPGVQVAAGADIPVGARAGAVRGFAVGGNTLGSMHQISSQYFMALGRPPLAGREFTEAEAALRHNVAILSRSALGLVWPGVSPETAIGRTLQLDDGPTRTVVGIVKDLKPYYGSPAAPSLYVPLGTTRASYTVVLRPHKGARLDSSIVRQQLQQEFGELRLALTDVPSLFQDVLRDPRFRSVLFLVLACTAVLIAAIGLYAVTNLHVQQREYEMGVRLSLGANPWRLQMAIVAQACGPIVAGLIAGTLIAYWLSELLRVFLFGIQPDDPWSYFLAWAFLVTIAGLAAWIPARRVGRLDPINVLRMQ